MKVLEKEFSEGTLRDLLIQHLIATSVIGTGQDAKRIDLGPFKDLGGAGKTIPIKIYPREEVQILKFG